jgi:methionine biosynthesis protein MetW
MAHDATRYREIVEQLGLSTTHKQVISWVAPGSRVLELGCASGYIGRLLIETKGCRVTGVEVDPNAAREARENGLTVIEGSLEDISFRNSITQRFDVVLATDVLEHLRDPASVLDDFKRWLAPGGRAIIAVPNIATWPIREQLFFRGDFEYQESGILDRTHVHFFTWNTLHKLVRDQRWSVLDSAYIWHLPFGKGLFDAPGDLRANLEKLAANGVVGRLAHASLGGGLGRLDRAAQAILNKIYNRWPNVCAWHITLLLAPPSNGATQRDERHATDRSPLERSP